MKSENKNDQNRQPEIEADMKTSENRRKLIRGGLVAAPVLLALKSTPVLAFNCKLPSGFSTSGNLSRNHGASCAEPTSTPVFWSTRFDSSTKKFTGTNVKTTDTFHSIFTTDSSTTNLLSILTSDATRNIFVAAYLDALVGQYSFAGATVTAPQITQMYAGTYIPNGSLSAWSRAESESYLKYTMGI